MNKKDILLCLALVIFILLVVLPHSSNSPDGLERAALDKGFAPKAALAPVPDSRLKTVLGVLFVFGIGYWIGSFLSRRGKPHK